MDVLIAKEGLDPEWDHFLEALPDNLYQQSSLWAQVKAQDGWQCLRVVVRDHGQIVGGVQVLLRPLPLYGAVGYVPKGPVVASDNPPIQEFVLDSLDRAAQTEHVLFIKMQPAHGAEAIAQRLLARGARPSKILVTPLSTLRIDLRQEREEILARMNKYTRRNIRRAERDGVTVRMGTEADIPIFIQLQQMHGKRRGYKGPSKDYYYHLWSNLEPGAHFCFFIAEYNGQALAANSYIAFGDTVADYHLADNGLWKELNAPTLLQWKGMVWGKEHGYSWYDFGGIHPTAAEAIVSGAPLPETSVGRRAKFKHSFGGQILFRPGVYDMSFVWPRPLTIRLVPALIKIKPLLSTLVGGGLSGYIQMHDRAARKLAVQHDDKNDGHGNEQGQERA